MAPKKKDSVHLACAHETACKYFVTTDNGIIKKKDAIEKLLNSNVVNPVELILLIGDKDEK